MGTYRVAKICPNGHVATTAADQNHELWEAFCSQSGEATILQCPKYNASIRGDDYVEGVLGFGGDYEPPTFCNNCGSRFPWTERKIAGTVELVEAGADLMPDEVQQFRTDLTELTKDSPKTQVACLRFKKVMAKVRTSVTSGVRDIVVDVFSEAAKKAI
ncbi:DUF2321 domain-containing protein [Xylella fastidiosa]|uniref:DUF2321 domain-containing protein n=1 Tax=Xylella fastidiosa TaxID=2371 RepID=A0ABC8AC74_XYLFS|nr:DUF2321 domain-containing protein [Xylella fastidiosa]ALR05919.1 DUF2321 domain-containing protein [Xylella fastidiosa]